MSLLTHLKHTVGTNVCHLLSYPTHTCGPRKICYWIIHTKNTVIFTELCSLCSHVTQHLHTLTLPLWAGKSRSVQHPPTPATKHTVHVNKQPETDPVQSQHTRRHRQHTKLSLLNLNTYVSADDTLNCPCSTSTHTSALMTH